MESPILVSVRWADAHASAASSLTLTDVGDVHKPSIMETTGWLLKDDEVGISLAYERSLDEGDESFRGYTFIPRGMVLACEPVIKVRKRTSSKKQPTPTPTPERGPETA